MKNLLFVLIVVGFGCNHQIIKSKNTENVLNRNLNTNYYLIEKIDSVANFYIIYAGRGAQKFKIISIMTQDTLLTKIKCGNRYDLRLFSVLKDVKIDDISLPNFHNIDCVALNDTLSTCIERQNFIYDLFRAKNLRGLYFWTPITQN